MINFFNWLKPDKSKSLKILNDVYLKQGEILNIYGEPYVGKTLFTYYIINNNIDKIILLFDTENSLYPILEKMGKKIHIIYSLTNDLNIIKNIIKTSLDIVDYFIIDSITATDLENNDKRSTLMQIFNLVQTANKNLILVSQVRGLDKRIFYENKRLLNFMAYKAEVKDIKYGCIVNDKYVIKKNDLMVQYEN
jgi:hypothetical protein